MGLPKPVGYHTATAMLLVKDAAAEIRFCEAVFDAHVTEKLERPGGGIAHAELRIGDSMLMIGEHADAAAPGQGLPPVSVYLYVEDADETFRRALAAGAKELYPVRQQFYGNREGGIIDPNGITWWVATRVEELTPAQVQARAAEALSQR
jgi:PhnB protein